MKFKVVMYTFIANGWTMFPWKPNPLRLYAKYHFPIRLPSGALEVNKIDPLYPIHSSEFNNIFLFWKVTTEDIIPFRSLHIDVELWKQLIQAALIGNTEFRGEPLDRKLVFSRAECTISWVSRLEGSIDVRSYLFYHWKCSMKWIEYWTRPF